MRNEGLKKSLRVMASYCYIILATLFTERLIKRFIRLTKELKELKELGDWIRENKD